MNHVEPEAAQLEAFAGAPADDQPITMINLLRFRQQAAYSGDAAGRHCSGREAYQRYSRAVMPLLWEAGGSVLLHGRVRFELIAPGEEKWDEFALVSYPSRAAFLKMINADAYRQILHHRQAALQDSRLLETQLERLPRAFLAGARQLVRIKALFSPRLAKA